MRMTKQQFDEAVDLLEQEAWPDEEETMSLFGCSLPRTSSCANVFDCLKTKRGLGLQPGELSEFLVGLNEVQRKRLKQIAETRIGGPETIFH